MIPIIGYDYMTYMDYIIRVDTGPAPPHTNRPRTPRC